VVELLEDVVGAHSLRHLRGARPGKFPLKPVNVSLSCKLLLWEVTTPFLKITYYSQANSILKNDKSVKLVPSMLI
jgi:hypothetical protein